MAVRLAILRPAGVLGDESDATTLEDIRIQGGFALPANPLPLADYAGAGTIEFMRFYMRAGWYSFGVGPSNPSATLQWRVGSGSYVNGDPEQPPQGVGVLQTFTSIDVLLNPQGGPWSLAEVNGLEMRTSWFANDDGSGVATVSVLAELWAEAWGSEPSPPPGPGGADIIRVVPLRSGRMVSQIASGDLTVKLSSKGLNAPLGSGHIRGQGRPA